MERAAQAIEFTLDSWRALPEQGGLALSRKDEVLDQAVERLRDWLEQHSGEANRRALLRAAAGGARTAADLDELLDRYQAVYPGTVSQQAAQRGARGGGGGTAETVVKSPRRVPTTGVKGSPVGVSADTKTSRTHATSEATAEYGMPRTQAEQAVSAAADTKSADTKRTWEPRLISADEEADDGYEPEAYDALAASDVAPPADEEMP